MLITSARGLIILALVQTVYCSSNDDENEKHGLIELPRCGGREKKVQAPLPFRIKTSFDPSEAIPHGRCIYLDPTKTEV